MKLHEEEVMMLQQDLDRKTVEVGNLKKELEQRHERMSQVGSLLAKQECDEMVYTYTDTAEHNVLEKNQNDHLKTRLQMEKIDYQIQLTRACLQKKDIESKLDAVKHHLQMSEKVCQRTHELYKKSTGAAHIVYPRSTSSFSSTTSDDSDVSTWNRSKPTKHKSTGKRAASASKPEKEEQCKSSVTPRVRYASTGGKSKGSQPTGVKRTFHISPSQISSLPHIARPHRPSNN